MFTELTAQEAKALDLHLFHSERDMKSRIGALHLMKQTRPVLNKTLSYVGALDDVNDMRNALMVERPLTF